MKGQSSVELLTTVALAMLLLIPATTIFMNYTSATTSQISSNQLVHIGNDIIFKVNEMHSLGRGSFTTIDIHFPDTVEEAYILNQTELNIKYRTDAGTSDLLFYSSRVRINTKDDSCKEICDLNFHSGTNRVRIQSQGENVSIFKVD